MPESVDLQQIPCVFHQTGIKVSFRVLPDVEVPEEASECPYHVGTSTDNSHTLSTGLCREIFVHFCGRADPTLVLATAAFATLPY